MIHERSDENGATGKRSLSQEAEGGKQETTESQQPREGTGRNQKQERRKKQREHTEENPTTKATGAIFETSKLEF